MGRLANGTIVPSYMDAVDTSSASGDSELLNGLSLRVGEIREIIYPKDYRNVSQKFVEYRVSVQCRDSQGRMSLREYQGVRLASAFGGMADKVRYTFRAAEHLTPAEKDASATGSLVLLLCVNGEMGNALIIGGVRRDENEKDRDTGHSLFWEFNGVRVVINDSGELLLEHHGATTADGKLRGDMNRRGSGGTLAFAKNGDVILGAPETVAVLELRRSEAQAEIRANDKIFLKSAGVHVGDATDAWLLATTYRDKEQELHDDWASNLQTLTTQIGAAGAALTTAGASMVVPVTGAVAAAPQVSAAASQLVQAASTVAKMVASLKKFEAQKDKFLSKKNKHD